MTSVFEKAINTFFTIMNIQKQCNWFIPNVWLNDYSHFALSEHKSSK